MLLKHKGENYQIKVGKTMDCPAGTAYWVITAHAESKPGETQNNHPPEYDTLAIAKVDTGAIYGPPDITHSLPKLKEIIDQNLAALLG